MKLADARPNKLDDIIGLDHNKDLILYNTSGAIKLGEPPRSYIAVGPAGTGKSTIAGAIATITGGNLFKFLGSDISKPQHLYEIASRLIDGDVCIIEEAHTISKLVQAVLLEWIENFKILGGAEYNIFDAPKVTFVFPTTNAGKLSKALRTRCIILSTNFYSINDIKKILLTAASKVKLDLSSDDEALTILAQSSRGTPRIAVMHRLDLLRKVMAVDNLPFNKNTVLRVLQINHINIWGLEKNDIEYCKVLYRKTLENKGRPVSKKILIESTGFESDIVEDMIEAYLHQIGVIRIETRGRSLTDFGYEMLGFDPIMVDPVDELVKAKVDLDELSKLVEDEDVRKLGMKGIAPKLGLRYGTDNLILKDALESIGYTSRKSVGIVKL